MSEDRKKVEETKPGALATEMAEQDLNQVAGGTGEATTQKVQHSDIHITKILDSSSPKLY
jgi:type VI protein secretion system component Hcp